MASAPASLCVSGALPHIGQELVELGVWRQGDVSQPQSGTVLDSFQYTYDSNSFKIARASGV